MKSIFTAVCLLLTGLVSAEAQSFNVNFGLSAPLSTSFGAAANQAGVWNIINNGNAATLQNLAGTNTSVQMTVTADNFSGLGGNHTGDLLSLLDLNFFTNGTSWVVSVVGLTDGLYDLYYYAPSNGSIDTGAFTVNGLNAANITGDNTSPLTQGLNWQVLNNITVTGGTLTMTAPPGFTGLGGLQLVAVPEPGTAALLGGGLVFVLIHSIRRRPKAG